MLSFLSIARIEEVPEFGALVLGVPLAMRIAKGVNPFLGARFLFVSAGAAERSVKSAFRQGVEKGFGLQQSAALLCAKRKWIRAASDAPLRSCERSVPRRFPWCRSLETRSFPGICSWYRRAARGKGIFPGKKAFCASRSITEESLPMEYSITGCENSATASRRM